MKFSLPEEKLSSAAGRMQSKAERFFRPKTVGLLFAAIVVVLGVFSLVVVLRERGKPEGTGEETVDNTAAVSTPQTTAGDNDFLLAFIDDDDDTLLMLAALHADERDGIFSVRYLSPQMVANVNNLEDTLQAHFLSGGGAGLRDAVSDCLGSNIDRYVIFDDDDFITMAKLMGDHTLTVNERIQSSYKGISFIIEPGTQTMIADTLCKYFAYLCGRLYQGGEDEMTDLLSDLATKMFYDTSEPMDQHLQRYVACMSSTNIIASDFGPYAASLPLFLYDDQVKILCKGVVY